MTACDMTQRKIVCWLLIGAVGTVCPHWALSSVTWAADVTVLSRRILDASAVRGGLVVHLGCGDGQLTAALRAGKGYVVHGLDPDPAKVQIARKYILSQGLYGEVAVERLGGTRLPYTDNLVNLLVAEELGPIPMEEVLRVLVPQGVAYINTGGRWRKTVKPRPQEIDQWTHFLHDASNNPVAHDKVVGPPRHFQWTAGPTWVRHHDHVAGVNALVSSGGRIFYIIDEAPTASILLPPKWSLVARDAMNGVVLWKRAIPDWMEHLWPLKSGPAQLPRRLIAVDDRVFVTLGIDAPLSMLDAATGDTLRTYPDSQNTEELISSDGMLFLLVSDHPNAWSRYRVESLESPQEKARVSAQWTWDEQARWLVAVEPETGARRWKKAYRVAPLTLAADRQRVYFYDGEKVVALRRANGEPLWASMPISRRPTIPANYGPNLIVSDDVVLFAGGERSMTAMAADSGKTLWSAAHPPSGYNSPEDLFVIQGDVWAGATANSTLSGAFTRTDLHTGKVRQEFSPDNQIFHFPHHRCYRSKATDNYVMTSRTGIELIDTCSGHWDFHHWVRGGCLYGLMPCNGLIYTPPHDCACFVVSKLNGFCALAPRGKADSQMPEVNEETRLEKGPAYGQISNPQALMPHPLEWPTYRHDAARSGATGSSVQAELELVWQVPLHGPLSAPTVADGKLFVAEIGAHTLHALDAHDGSPRWQFTVGGRVDSPPTVYRGSVLFGSTDGWVYCLRASDGQLTWRFRAAAEERKIMASGQLESAWPVHGSVLVQNNTLYCVAGRSMFLDGGLRLLRLDPVGGRKLGEVIRNELDPDTGKNLQDRVNQTQSMRIAVALPDILSSDGDRVFMLSNPIDFDETGSSSLTTSNPKPKSGAPLIGTSSGFLDDSWMNRLGWRCGQSPLSRLLVSDTTTAYGSGFSPQYQKLTPHRHHLFAAHPRTAARAKDGSKTAALLWSETKLPLLVRAMVLADQTLFVAGPPDLGMTADEDDYRNYHDSKHQAAQRAQAEAWEGKRGGLLWAVSKTDGKRLAERKLSSPPVWDGMAAAYRRLYLCTADGHLLCLGRKSP